VAIPSSLRESLHDPVSSHAAFRYVDVVIGAFVAAAFVVFALGFILAPGEAVARDVEANQLQAELNEVI
jgi:hypothetical protein